MKACEPADSHLFTGYSSNPEDTCRFWRRYLYWGFAETLLCCFCKFHVPKAVTWCGLVKSAEQVQSEDEDVCNGTLALEGPVIASSLRDLVIGSKTAQIFCTTLLGLCEYPEVEPYTVPVPPQPINTTARMIATVNVTGRPVFKVAHFSDIHIDPLYVVGSNANCSKPMCCRYVCCPLRDISTRFRVSIAY